MVRDAVDLKSEERRRQVTLSVLGILLFATTLPVVNQRALFSPFGDVPILGELSPTAYAMIIGGLPSGYGPRPGGSRGGAGGPVPPSAYAARTPGTPSLGGSAPPTGTFPGAPGSSGIPGSPVGSGPTSPIANDFVSGSTPGAGGGGPGGGIDDVGGTGTGTPPPTPGPVGAVPEPATWLTMILGFGIIGSIMRRSRRRKALPVRVEAGLSEG